jgi:hypothetical protein
LQWSLPKRKRVNRFTYKHTNDCADIYLSLLFTSEDFEWSFEGNEGDIRFDRRLIFNGKTFYFEIERGTQGIEIITEKVRRYCQLPNSPHVVFTVQDYEDTHRFKSAKDQGQKILELLTTFRRGNQFLVTPHQSFVADPFGDRLISPLNTVHSLKTL